MKCDIAGRCEARENGRDQHRHFILPKTRWQATEDRKNQNDTFLVGWFGLEKKNNILHEEEDARFIFTTLTVKKQKKKEKKKGFEMAEVNETDRRWC